MIVWPVVGAVMVMAAIGLFPRWHWAAQLGLAMASGTVVVVVYYGVVN
jgi:hypothetical protein